MLTANRSAVRAAVVILTVLCAVVSGLPAQAAAEGEIRGAETSAAIPGRYLVVLDEGVRGRARDSIKDTATALSDRYGGRLGAVYERTLSGFAIAMDEAQARRLAADPRVAYVEQEHRIVLAETQENPPSPGLDRIDQRALPLDTTYTYDVSASTAVTVYVVDTGIRITHQDFGGRASNGWDFIGNDGVAEDCHGHGTHMAGTIAGTLHGVAKNARLKAVRAFDCFGISTTSSVQSSIEWITVNAVKPAVANLSLAYQCLTPGGNPAPCPAGEAMSIRTAISNSVAAGISYALAAGNDNIDACGSPFNLVTTAIVVGGSNNADGKLGMSSFGSCVDIWAPGEDILSAFNGSDSATTTGSGSSMATSHVSGALALMLARPGWATRTPAQLFSQLLSESTSGALTGLGAGSPNKLLFTNPPPVAGGSSVGLAHHDDGRLTLFGVNNGGTLFVRSQTAPNTSSWAPWQASVYPDWYSVCAGQDELTRMRLVGLRRTSQVWHRTQAVVNTSTWGNWAQFDGLLNSCAVTKENGKLYIFGTNAQGALWGRSEIVAGSGAFTSWIPISGVPVLRAVAAESTIAGNVQLFGLGRTGDIWHCWTIATNCAPAGWSLLDGQLKTIAAARNATGAVAIFGVNAQNQLWRRDSVPGVVNVWLPWEQLDVPANVGTLRSVAAEANADGRIELVAVNLAGQVWRRSQVGPGTSTYTAWTQLDGLLRP